MDNLADAATKPLLGIMGLLVLMAVVYVVINLVTRHFLTDHRRGNQKNVGSISHALGFGAMSVVAILYFLSRSSLWGAASTMPPGIRQSVLSSGPSVYQEVDNHGDSLIALVRNEYARYYSQEGTTCQATYNWKGDEWVPLEIAGCKISLAKSSNLTPGDSLNGIDLQGAGFIGGKAFRINSNSSWSEWRPLPGTMTFTPPIHFRRTFGRFELTPDNNIKKLRPILP